MTTRTAMDGAEIMLNVITAAQPLLSSLMRIEARGKAPDSSQQLYWEPSRYLSTSYIQRPHIAVVGVDVGPEQPATAGKDLSSVFYIHPPTYPVGFRVKLCNSSISCCWCCFFCPRSQPPKTRDDERPTVWTVNLIARESLSLLRNNFPPETTDLDYIHIYTVLSDGWADTAFPNHHKLCGGCLTRTWRKQLTFHTFSSSLIPIYYIIIITHNTQTETVQRDATYWGKGSALSFLYLVHKLAPIPLAYDLLRNYCSKALELAYELLCKIRMNRKIRHTH